ncbi:hypothetical protein JCM10213v2_008269 [Rhodosporidiobolus nylandii]
MCLWWHDRAQHAAEAYSSSMPQSHRLPHHYLRHTGLLKLPVNYFGGGVEGTDTEAEWWNNNQYNTLISTASSFLSAVFGYGIAIGFRAVLRRRIMQPRGVSLYEYDALAQFSQMQLQIKLRWTAVVAAAIFLVSQLFDPSTQAAYGSGVVQTNISVPFRRARISENINLLLPYLDNLTSFLSASDEADTNVEAVVNSLNPVPQDIQATILNTLEVSSTDDPLFAAQTQLQLIRGVYLDEVPSTLNERQRRMLAPSREIVAFAEVEGFLANATCMPFSPTYTTAPSDVLNATAFTISFPCGTKEAYYWTSPPSASFSSAPAVADAFICPDATPVLFVYSALPSPPSILLTYRCEISTSSSLVAMSFSPLLRTAHITSPPTSTVVLPTNLGVLEVLAQDLLDEFSGRGWRVLQNALDLVQQRAENLTEFVERSVETLVKVTLARASYAFTSAAENGIVPELKYEETESFYQVEALQIHLTRSTSFWLVPPLLLLFLLLFLAPYVLFPSSCQSTGRTDFTDCTDVALIALGSEADERLRGGGTGDFADEDGEREDRLRIRFGERVGKKEGEEGGRKLELTAGTEEEVKLRRPEEGALYV